MKELTIEQKAKAYDEALERMKSWVKGEHPECFTEAQKAAEFIFPELKESEGERIRKELTEFLKKASGGFLDSTIQCKTFRKWCAWLEKQGEKPQGKSALEAVKEEKVDNQNCVNPTDKNEPEFHGGEWVIYNHDICQIVKREEGCNKLVTVFGIEKELVNERNLSTAHLWTIQDAKDGDVLACGEEILLFKSYSVQGRISLYCWYNGQTNNFHNKEVVDVLLTTRNKVCPATKEQRDLLFSKMSEAGYEWDANKKELKKIEDEPENYKQQLMSEITDLVEDYISQKPTWSEEDEKILQWIITDIKRLINDDKKANVIANKEPDWLITLKERIGG